MKRLLSLTVALLIAAPAYGQVSLGTSTSSTNPQRSGDATTGVFSSATDAVSISSGGTEMMRVNGTGVGIGTASPADNLDVWGGTGTMRVINNSGATNVTLGAYDANVKDIYFNTITGSTDIAPSIGVDTLGDLEFIKVPGTSSYGARGDFLNAGGLNSIYGSAYWNGYQFVAPDTISIHPVMPIRALRFLTPTPRRINRPTFISISKTAT